MGGAGSGVQETSDGEYRYLELRYNTVGGGDRQTPGAGATGDAALGEERSEKTVLRLHEGGL